MGFGHTAIHGPGYIIDCWGAGPFLIHVDGKTFRFEDSDRFGPLFVKKDGMPAAKQPGEFSRFWGPYHAWRKQGRPLADDGETCLWHNEPMRAPASWRGK